MESEEDYVGAGADSKKNGGNKHAKSREKSLTAIDPVEIVGVGADSKKVGGKHAESREKLSAAIDLAEIVGGSAESR